MRSVNLAHSETSGPGSPAKRKATSSVVSTLIALVLSSILASSAARGDEFDAMIKLRLGMDADLHGDHDKAIRLTTEAIESHSLHEDSLGAALWSRGEAYKANHDFDDALTDFTAAIQATPAIAELFNARGIEYARRRDFDLAIGDFSKAVEITPTYAEAYYNRAGAKSDKGNYESAVVDFNQAISLKPDFNEAFEGRGFAYVLTGNYDHAISDEDYAIKLNPKNASAFFDRGQAHVRIRKYDRAVDDYAEAIRLSPEANGYLMYRGVAYFSLGKYRDAEADFSKRAAANPGNPYPAIWQYLAERRLGIDAKTRLSEKVAGFKSAEFPAMVVQLFLDKTTTNKMIAAIEDRDVLRARNQRCQAAFYAAEYDIETRDVEGASERFKEAARLCALAPTNYERDAISAEWRRLATLPAG